MHVHANARTRARPQACTRVHADQRSHGALTLFLQASARPAPRQGRPYPATSAPGRNHAAADGHVGQPESLTDCLVSEAGGQLEGIRVPADVLETLMTLIPHRLPPCSGCRRGAGASLSLKILAGAGDGPGATAAGLGPRSSIVVRPVNARRSGQTVPGPLTFQHPSPTGGTDSYGTVTQVTADFIIVMPSWRLRPDGTSGNRVAKSQSSDRVVKSLASESVAPRFRRHSLAVTVTPCYRCSRRKDGDWRSKVVVMGHYLDAKAVLERHGWKLNLNVTSRDCHCIISNYPV